MEKLSFLAFVGAIIIWFIVLGYVTNKQLNKRSKTISKRDFTYYSPNKKE